MEKYKIEFPERQFITEDKEPLQILNAVNGIRNRLHKLIDRHNYLIKLRDAIAQVAHEYMRSHMTEISNDENRHLLVRGCTAEIDEISDKILKIKIELQEALFLQK